MGCSVWTVVLFPNFSTQIKFIQMETDEKFEFLYGKFLVFQIELPPVKIFNRKKSLHLIFSFYSFQIHTYLLTHVNLFDLLAYRNDEMMMKTISFLFPQYSLRYLEAIWIIYFLFCYFLLVFFSLTFSCRCLILFFFIFSCFCCSAPLQIILWRVLVAISFPWKFFRSFSVSTQIYNCRIVDNITMVIPFLLIALMMLIQFVIAWKLSFETIKIKIMPFFCLVEWVKMLVDVNDERNTMYCLLRYGKEIFFPVAFWLHLHIDNNSSNK